MSLWYSSPRKSLWCGLFGVKPLEKGKKNLWEIQLKDAVQLLSNT